MVHSTRPLIESLEERKLFNGAVYTVGYGGQYSSVGAAVNVAGPGDEVLILPGTYHETLNLHRSGYSGQPITIAAKTAGTVFFNGWGLSTVINGTSAQFITLSGITVNGCSDAQSWQPAAITTNSNWVVENVTVNGAAGTGLSVFGNNVTITNITAEYCGRAGLSGNGCSNVLVQGGSTFGNNTYGNDPDIDGGAGKWTQTDHVTIDGLHSYNNTGPGIWFDYNNTNVTIRNCQSYSNHGLAHSWSGNGIRIEISQGPFLIQNNAFWGNTGANIDVEECRNVTIQGNWMQGTSLTLKDWYRGSAYSLYNVNISGNTFVSSQIYTEGGTWNSGSASTKQLVINHNGYQHSVNWLWGSSGYYSLSAIQNALGFEWQGWFSA